MENYIGKKFNSLTVLSSEHSGRNINLVCQCDCGKIKSIRKTSVVSGGTKSCGCFREKQMMTRFKTHGNSRSRFYRIWRCMKSRCNNKHYPRFSDYGGRGISVCEDWNKFENFSSDMFESYQKHCQKFGENKTSIDRIDNNKNYNLINCRWATPKEQCANRRHRLN